MSQSQYLQVALQAIKEAEEVITKYYSDEIRVTLKADRTPVTIADQEAEKIIRTRIHDAFPDHRILGEERGSDDTQSPFLWIIDPIDGTKNYMRKVPLFSSLLALMKDGEVILGVSNAPALGELAYAEKGQGTFVNGQKVHVSTIANIADAYLCFGSIGSFEKTHQLPSLLKIENATLAHRGIGDFWCYHLLAQGKVDIMVEAQTKLWDIAAVSILVQEAGGHVTDMNGNPVNESTTSIIATNKLLHEHVSSYFNLTNE
ncbi:inositol-phosphate phosphatase [Candidatus Woesebacteria bacterium]|nr:inositol-phosphate phosphatase [Candidatus Woesebacteria bacterium]